MPFTKSLLANSEGEGRDQILYQLARAHDLVGETDAAVGYLNRLVDEYPQSTYAVEARFRRAEIAFSAGQYREAERDYGFVVAQGRETPYWQNATYMQGWAQFKLGDLDDGLSSFFNVVDSVLADREFEELPATEQELLTDSLRVVTLALAYLDGPQTLAEHMRELQRPDWQYEVYRSLADDYLEDERFPRQRCHLGHLHRSEQPGRARAERPHRHDQHAGGSGLPQRGAAEERRVRRPLRHLQPVLEHS